MTEYKNIPNEVNELSKKIMNKKAPHRLLQGLEANYDLVMRDIDTCFAMASTITGLPPEEIIKRSDFRTNDLDSDRFDAMLAEIRTIVYLNKLGFAEIQPLKAPKGIKEADLLGKWNRQKWAIEVLCSSYKSGRWTHKEIANYIERRFLNDRKYEQLHRTAVKYKCRYKLLVVVMNSSKGKALNDRNDYLNILKDVWINLGRRKDLFLSIVTGTETLGSGSDDCIYPSYP